jgi:tRNA dimethylallyltransferase
VANGARKPHDAPTGNIFPMTDPVWVLTGPTASGKSGLALEVAAREGLEILSMDSMAVFRRMDLGTAKPSRADRGRVPHHLIDVVEPSEDFDVSRYCALAEAALADVHRRGRRALFVGGTPLYLMALFKGLMPGPPAQPELRAELEAREAAQPGALHAELAALDPEAAARIHRRDRKRLVRALEVVRLTGTAISAQQTSFAAPGWRLPCRIVALRRPREELHARVRQRARDMLAAGLLEETRHIRDSCGFGRQAAAAIGYAECLAHLAGRFKDLEELRNRIRRASHRLIRRQMTWLRHLPDVRWVEPQAGVAGVLAALRS